MERRRGVRIPGQLWIGLPPLIDPPQLCPGNLSISGLYFQTETSLRGLKQVQLIHVATSADRSMSIELVAQLVRLATCEDVRQGTSLSGAAFEFLFDSEEQRYQLETLTRQLGTEQLAEAGSIAAGGQLDAEVTRPAIGSEHRARLHEISFDRLYLETDLPIENGEALRVAIEAPGSGKAVRLSGRALSSTRLGSSEPSRYRVQVQLRSPNSGEAATAPGSTSIEEAIETLLTAVTRWQPRTAPTARDGMGGALTQVRLCRVLGVAELEQLSGVLRLERPDEQAAVYLREGQVIDVELSGAGADVLPVESLQTLLSWNDGTFCFEATAPEHADRERPDRIGTPTRALLATLARHPCGERPTDQPATDHTPTANHLRVRTS